jgi:DNA-binding MarR family transcriptional regulator
MIAATRHLRCSGEIVVYRIHFTVQDLARTRVAEAWIPAYEVLHAARAFQDLSQPVRMDAWRRRVRGRLSAQARMALSLIPPVGWSPSFMFPAQARRLEELVEAVHAIPRRRIDAELTFVAAQQTIPSWARRLADDALLRKQLVDGLASLYAVLLGPYEAQIADHFTADRTVRTRQFLSGGVERLLAQANPRWLRWHPPVLEIGTVSGVDDDLHLEGQGILLVPSVFATRPCLDDCAQPQPVVTYPAGHDLPLRRLTALTPEHAASKSSVSALLGRTRAAVLTTIAEYPGCSTKELATLAGIAPASASEHATVLRHAGLIHTIRHRNTAIHSPTNLGTAFLNGAVRECRDNDVTAVSESSTTRAVAPRFRPDEMTPKSPRS